MMRTLLSRRRLVVLALALGVLAVGAGSVLAARKGPDRTAPRVTVTKPADGSVTYDSTPRLAGKAGRARGDGRVVSVRLYPGSRAIGRPLRLVTARRSRGSWGVTLLRALPPGT